MCGIIAFLHNSELPAPLARQALASLRHRGPDACGEWSDEHVFLGHQRLSIIDLHTGGQPMHSSDERYVIVFNGEIYNYRELRCELQRSGAQFHTQSDTEVILEGYRRWGPTVAERLNGMFAFVIWDRSERIAFGARDRLGIKPLCWAVDGDVVIVSSTQEPFSQITGFDQLDPVAIRDLMTFDYVPTPRSIRKNVRKLEPGSRFHWRPGRGQPQVETYWRPPHADQSQIAPSEEELEELLDRAVSRQMISDVPIGVFLSGGIDSSLLVALMARHSDTPVKTYSVAFAEPGVDESAIAERVAQEFSTDHCVLRAEEIGAEALQELIGSLDEPFCDVALVPLHALSRLTRKHVKVALCGDGADEVFGGYPKYLVAGQSAPQLPFSSLMRRSLEALPWRPRGAGHLYCRTLPADERLGFSTISRYGDFPVFRKDLNQLLAPELRGHAGVADYFEPWERHRQPYGATLDTDVLMRADLRTYLSENCLVKTDRASMLASLEVRVPFLDELVLDRVLPLHSAQKLRNGQLKALLLPMAKRLLPREVWDRPKHGFEVPLPAKLAGPWRPVVEQALHWGARNLPVFNYAYLQRLHRINLSETSIGTELWNPVVLITWAMAQRVRV